MSKFVLELGFESGEGEFRQWESQGFYQGYSVQGPIIVSDVNEAFQFESVERASWMPNGDARLKAHRIKPLEFYHGQPASTDQGISGIGRSGDRPDEPNQDEGRGGGGAGGGTQGSSR